MGNFSLEEENSSSHDIICTLSQDTLRIAQSDLSEDENTRTLGLQQIRDWLALNPNIKKCRTDSSFLLRFLRMKKFRVGEAKQLLEQYLKMRTENPSWFRSLDVKDHRLADLIDRGYFFALKERDTLGRRVFFSIPARLDTSRDTAADMMRGVQIGLESLIEEEENQVRGFVYVFDEKSVGLSVVTLWTPSEVSKAFHCSEKTIPVRHKDIHFLNLPLSFYAIFEIAKRMLSEKIKQRFQLHNDIEQLEKFVPRRILPKEYGGEVPMKEMIDSYKMELEAVRNKVLRLDDIEWTKTSKHKKLERSSIHQLNRSFCHLEID